MNSFKFAKDAASTEIDNQITYWETHGSPKQEQVTALWDVKEKQVKVMRNKENAQDYRYIKEPDIPAIDISSLIDDIIVDENLLPYYIEKTLIDAGIHPKDSKYFSADIQKARILFAICEKTADVNTTAKALLNGFSDKDFIEAHIDPVADIIIHYKK
jgi:Asp-tRNA(Asn)/Glu-tRNA(Gln) amidotransferase B subunit